MLVGTAVINARQMIPDMPGAMPPPILSTPPSATAQASTLAIGVYFLVITYLNNWGETIPSAEQTVTTTGPDPSITLPGSVFIPAGVRVLRVYLTFVGGAAGSEQQFVEFTGAGPYIISANPVNPGVPPTRNTCWLPDSDGGFISATAIFGWVNEGLHMISQETQGLLDYFAIPSVIQQPLYTVPGQWTEWTSVWYDGYWMMGGDRGMFFRRNTITSQILSSATLSVRDNRNILEVYPQPARTAQITGVTLTAPLTITDQQASATGQNFVLPFGFMDIDFGTPKYEIIAYSQFSSTQIQGLIRALGGTTAQAHSVSANIRECNLAISGKRIFTGDYVPGQSAVEIPVPSGWSQLLLNYVAGRAKLVEHDSKAWSEFMQEMRAEIKLWANTNKGYMKRRQVGGNASPAVLYADISGGLILP